MDENRVLIFPPTRRDAEAARNLLEGARIVCSVCASPSEVAAGIRDGAGALVLTDSALNAQYFDAVLAELVHQPAWSDLPVLLICSARNISSAATRMIAALTNVTLLDRPASARALISAIQAALRARHRQYEMRQQLAALREAEENLRARERDLRIADRRKDEFLAMLAHELRNPLAPIRSASELLTRVLPEQLQVRTMAEILKRQVAHLTRIVDDLLDVSRITQGRIDLKREPVAVSRVVADALEGVEPLIRDKRHHVAVRGAPADLFVDGDSARLVQCVSNLLTNAIKYTDPPGRIQVEARAEGNEAVISVADNGVGITPDLLPQIFDLFVQSARSLDRAQGGLGIGLSLVRRLIDMHGGRVSAFSDGVGRGARFEIRLPRVAALPASASEAPRTAGPGRRILIVDDNEDAADSLAMILNSMGHAAQAVYGPEAALEHLREQPPDAVLLDIGLPRMNGYEVAARIRNGGSAVRLIAVSGYGRSEDVQRAQAAGFDAHLMKPVDMLLLESALAAQLHPNALPAPPGQAGSA